GLAVFGGDAPLRPLALVLILDVAQVELLIPVPGLLEVLVRKARLVGVAIDAEREEDVVEPLAEAIVEGILFHDGVEDRGLRLPSVPGERGDSHAGREPAGQREGGPAKQPAVVEHRHALEERGRLGVHRDGWRLPGPEAVYPPHEVSKDAI